MISETPLKFEFQATEDGSPTARIIQENQGDTPSEAMHSLRGAFSETVYIYGTAIETTLTKAFKPHVLSMGLGLGYVEILAAALFVKNKVSGGGDSYELVPELRENFLAWVRNEGKITDDFADTYEQILQRTSDYSGVPREEIKSCLRLMLEENRWRVHGALTNETQFADKFGCICFDAFSSKSTPEVWGEEFLNAFLERSAASCCVLSTYACTGALKRSLRAAGFELTIREGFSSKRDSTFAVREL